MACESFEGFQSCSSGMTRIGELSHRPIARPGSAGLTKDDGIGSGQIDTESSRSGTEHEHEDVRAVEAVCQLN